MDWNEILQKVPEVLNLIAQLVASLVVIASIVGQIMSRVFGKKDIPGSLEAYDRKVFKVINWLPTIGVNPRTKALEQALKDVKGVPKE